MQYIDRATFIQHLTKCVFRYQNNLARTAQPAPVLTDCLTVEEAGILVFQLMMLALRGALAADCITYATSGNVELPFTGCEQRIFDTLLAEAKMRESIGGNAIAIVEWFASSIGGILGELEQETGVPATDIVSIITAEPAYACA